MVRDFTSGILLGYGSLGTNERGTSLSSLESMFGVISISVSRDIYNKPFIRFFMIWYVDVIIPWQIKVYLVHLIIVCLSKEENQMRKL